MLALWPYARSCSLSVGGSAQPLNPPKKQVQFGIGPSEIIDIIKHIELDNVVPEPVDDGCGGVYKLVSSGEETRELAIFKPFDEEVENTRNMGFIREYAAYQIDAGMAGVPATGIACFPWNGNSELGTVKLGAMQKYIQDGESAADLGSGLFNTEDVHRIGILDIRILNCDRHSGNMLFSRKSGRLIPIDHGLSFPSAFSDLGKVSFDWLLYPAAKEPFSDELLREIEAIDIQRDISIMQTLGISPSSQLSLWMSTVLLKLAAGLGLTLYQIGTLVQRQGDRSESSVLEKIFNKSLQIVKMYKGNFMSVFVECIYSHLLLML